MYVVLNLVKMEVSVLLKEIHIRVIVYNLIMEKTAKQVNNGSMILNATIK